MKFIPRAPAKDINTPAAPVLGNVVALVIGAVGIVGLFFAVVSFVVDAVVDSLEPEAEIALFGEWLPLMFEPFGEAGWSTAAQDALQPLFDRAREAAPPLAYDFQLRVSCMEAPNALALPGGGIVVTAGLLKVMETEEELIFVLGHELGHFVHRDHLRGMGRAAALQIGMGMVSLTTGMNPTQAVEIALEAFTTAHSREQEVAADAVGAEALAKLKDGDVSAAHRALNALHGATGSSGLDQVDFLRSHPVGEVRREALDALIADRQWRQLRQRGTPLNAALKAPCSLSTMEPAVQSDPDLSGREESGP